MSKKIIFILSLLPFLLFSVSSAESIADKVKNSDLIIVGLLHLDKDNHPVPTGTEGTSFIIPTVISVLKGKVIKEYTNVIFDESMKVETYPVYDSKYGRRGKGIFFLKLCRQGKSEYAYYTGSIIPYSEEIEREVINLVGK